MMSHDVEDVVAVVAGRDSLLLELAAAPRELRRYLASRTPCFLSTMRMPMSPSKTRCPTLASHRGS